MNQSLISRGRLVSEETLAAMTIALLLPCGAVSAALTPAALEAAAKKEGAVTYYSAQTAADAADGALSRLLGQLPLPQRLREIGVTDKDLAPIATATMSDYMMANVPAPMSAGDIESLLREAW